MILENSPSSTGAGVDSFDFAASLGFAFAFANDLKISPAVLFFEPTDLVESDLFRVLGTAAGWGVVRPDVLSSDALPLREDVDASLESCAATGGFAVDLTAGLAAGLAGATAAGGGAYLAVLRYGSVSYEVSSHERQKCSHYLNVRILYRPIYSPSFQWILVRKLRVYLAIARCQYVQVLLFLVLLQCRWPLPFIPRVVQVPSCKCG